MSEWYSLYLRSPYEYVALTEVTRTRPESALVSSDELSCALCLHVARPFQKISLYS